MVYKNAKDWICPYCNLKVKSRRKLRDHLNDCDKKKGLPTDSLGRTIAPGQYDAMIRKTRELAAHGMLGGHKHNSETRKHLSEVRQQWLTEHPNHGVKWFTVNGIKVQGTWEKRFAEHLNNKGIVWRREKLRFLNTHYYTPDFYCPNENVYFEVKGFRRDRDIYKMYLVLAEHPELQIKMIEREQINNLDKINIFDLPNFQDLYKLEDVDVSKYTNVWN